MADTTSATYDRPSRLTPDRSTYLHIRISVEERGRILERARAAGYETLSDYVRAAALGSKRHRL